MHQHQIDTASTTANFRQLLINGRGPYLEGLAILHWIPALLLKIFADASAPHLVRAVSAALDSAIRGSHWIRRTGFLQIQCGVDPVLMHFS